MNEYEKLIFEIKSFSAWANFPSGIENPEHRNGYEHALFTAKSYAKDILLALEAYERRCKMISIKCDPFEDFMRMLPHHDTITLSIDGCGATSFNARIIHKAILRKINLPDEELLQNSHSWPDAAIDEDTAFAIEQCENALQPERLESDGEWSNYCFPTSAIKTILDKLRQMRQEPCDECKNYENDFYYCPFCGRKAGEQP
jgi:hypothetical protein